MNTLWFIAMLAGVGWLTIWTVLPQQYRGKGWWLFDMREDDSPASQDHNPAPLVKERRGATSSWRERARARATTPDERRASPTRAAGSRVRYTS